MLLTAAVAQPADHPPTRARPLEPLANWVSDRDYPAEAMRREAQGVTHFRLVVDERGSVESCTVTESSNDPALDAATCSVMSIRARFEPARDAAGHAVRDTIESRIRWVLPDERAPTVPFEPTRYFSSIHATAAGETQCSTNAGWDANSVLSGDCGLFSGSGAAARMRAARSEATLTGILTLSPQGTPPPGPGGGPAGYGTTLVEVEVVVEIAANGSISACRVARYQLFVAAPAAPIPPDVCRAYPVGAVPMFEPAGQPDQVRVMNISLWVYLRGTVPGLLP
jgi:TonB family protein